MDKKQRVDKIMNLLAQYCNPIERTTLNRMRKKPEPFKILISCLLSLRTQDKNTEKASKALFAVADTPKKIMRLPIKKLERLIYSSGHYKKKSRVLKNVCSELIKKHKGEVPQSREELLAIKGIGPKTANIVLAFAYQQDALPIDTHCHRIPNRLALVSTKTPEKTERALEKLLPRKYWKDFNALFVLFGKTICVPISPKCSICPISKYCMRINVTKSR